MGLPLSTPTNSPAAGLYSSPVLITLVCATAGASIGYTVDGTTPTESGQVPTGTTILYTGPFVVSSTTNVQFFAFKSGSSDTAVVAANYAVAPNVLQTHLTTLTQILGTANPFLKTEQTDVTTALNNVRKGTATTADLELMQSLIEQQVEQFSYSGPYQAGQLTALKSALAAIRSQL